MSFLFSYGLFLLKAITVVVAIVFVLTMTISATQRRHKSGHLQITSLSRRYRQMQAYFSEELVKAQDEKQHANKLKKAIRLKRKQEKQTAKQQPHESEVQNLYVLDFKGGIAANEVVSLREEVTAILAVAKTGDEVLIRIESGGGVVHGYGLAAAQLLRLREGGLKLTATIDKVAASGGYMMACIAQHIIAAPFAIVGSIGVVAQLPNFNRLLKRHDVDVELHTAGAYKRTLTLFGENSQQGREKFCDELNQTHRLFKQFVHQMRPALDIEQIATGEHWYGQQAEEKKLIDEISTSDAFIIRKMAVFNVIGVRYVIPKKTLNRLAHSGLKKLEHYFLHWWQRNP